MSARLNVTIIGGGPAGAIAALVLARAGHQVRIVDQAKPILKKIGESLPSAARPLLRALGLLDMVENGPHMVSHGNRSAWGGEQIDVNDFIRDPNGLGWHLDRQRFDHDLRRAAEKVGVEILQARVESTTPSADGWRLQTADCEWISDWIIDASGRGAQFARRFGAVRKKDDDLMAVYAWLSTPSSDVDSRTLIESAPNGWWYTARLPDSSRILSFQTDPVYAGRLLRSNSLWQETLAQSRHVRDVIDPSAVSTTLLCGEACGSRLDRFYGDRWLATGDSALAFDPLSSQGLFNAIYSGMKAGEAVAKSLSANDSQAVHEYADRLESIRHAYIGRRRLYYSTERRWLNQSFWKRRT